LISLAKIEFGVAEQMQREVFLLRSSPGEKNEGLEQKNEGLEQKNED